MRKGERRELTSKVRNELGLILSEIVLKDDAVERRERYPELARRQRRIERIAACLPGYVIHLFHPFEKLPEYYHSRATRI